MTATPIKEHAPGECRICGVVDDPETPFIHHLCSGMRRVADEDRVEFSPETKAKLLAFMDEADRCRGRAAVEARSHFIG